jgi:hypothetical protein
MVCELKNACSVVVVEEHSKKEMFIGPIVVILGVKELLKLLLLHC